MASFGVGTNGLPFFSCYISSSLTEVILIIETIVGLLLLKYVHPAYKKKQTQVHGSACNTPGISQNLIES